MIDDESTNSKITWYSLWENCITFHSKNFQEKQTLVRKQPNRITIKVLGANIPDILREKSQQNNPEFTKPAFLNIHPKDLKQAASHDKRILQAHTDLNELYEQTFTEMNYNCLYSHDLSISYSVVL